MACRGAGYAGRTFRPARRSERPMAAVLEPPPIERARAELVIMGYEGTFIVGDDGLVSCDVCGISHEPTAIRTPATCLVDGVLVLAAMCTCCSQRGTAVTSRSTVHWGDLTADE